MLFNSVEYFLFLPLVFSFYWFILKDRLKCQNLLILISSYIFYGWWDWRFLSLIFFSTIVDYIVGLKIYDSQNIKVRRSFLWLSIICNIGLLGFFKYHNFFIDSWIDLIGSFGYEIKSIWTLSVILPVGISFYTFQTMSYSLDIYYKKLKPTKDFISFASFVSFFPQLVAGPIERASNLLPQILNKRKFNYKQGAQGLRLILWGMFKKVVIADSLGPKVDRIFSDFHYRFELFPQTLEGGVLLLGLLYFAIQIYCDFSGYSDIAIGTAKLFGIELMSNFKFPYFSRDIGEFWRKWHISLSSWFRDYLYIPLGGSKKGQWHSIRNIFIIFIVSGFWHGSNWTFIVWGLMHSLLYLPLFLIGKNRRYTNNIIGRNGLLSTIKEVFQIGVTFFSTMIAWAFFRSESVTNAVMYLYRMITELSIPTHEREGLIYVLLIISLDFLIRDDERLTDKLLFKDKYLEFLAHLTLSILILFYLTSSSANSFIYFQF